MPIPADAKAVPFVGLTLRRTILVPPDPIREIRAIRGPSAGLSRPAAGLLDDLADGADHQLRLLQRYAMAAVFCHDELPPRNRLNPLLVELQLGGPERLRVLLHLRLEVLR